MKNSSNGWTGGHEICYISFVLCRAAIVYSLVVILVGIPMIGRTQCYQELGLRCANSVSECSSICFRVLKKQAARNWIA